MLLAHMLCYDRSVLLQQFLWTIVHVRSVILEYSGVWTVVLTPTTSAMKPVIWIQIDSSNRHEGLNKGKVDERNYPGLVQGLASCA